ncbi:MAG: hypothetical protein ABI954_07980 [Pyrinomonadaceae bacterium]
MVILGIIGSLLFVVGWIWVIVTAFKGGGALWGILNILLCIQPIIGIISAILKKTAWLPVGLMILGIILSALGTDYSAMYKAIEDAQHR